MYGAFAIRRRRRPLLWLIGAAVCVTSQPATLAAQSPIDWMEIRGCWSALPLGIGLSGEFNRRCERMATQFLACGSHMVVFRLLERECDVGLILHTLGPSAEEELRGKCEVFPLGRFAAGVVVNAKNPVRTMGTEGLGNVFQGKVDTWGAVDGTRGVGRIVLYATNIESTEGHIFKHTVMRGRFSPALERYESRETAHQRFSVDGVMGAVIQDAGAIGFFMVGPETRLDDRVRLLGISKDRSGAGVRLAAETIADGTYPLADRLTIYLHPEASPMAREFVDFATGPEGAKILKQFGLWPEYELEKVRGEQRVADVKAGKGEPVAVCDLAGVGEALKAAALEFARAKMAVQVTLDAAGGSAEQARERLKTGEAELLVVDGGMGEEGLRGQGMEEGGERMVLGSRAVGVVVHPGNSFHELTMDDLRQILAGKVDRWPGATGTAERIVLYGLPPTNPLMQLMDRAMGADVKRGKVTVRPDSERVILSVAAQPGSLGLVDLTKVARHETKVKLLAILPAGETEAAPPAPDRVPEAYPLASPVALHLSPKASDAAQAFFAFLKEGGGRDALLGGGLVPQPLPDVAEAEIAEAYGAVDEPKEAGPPTQVAAAKEDDSPATAATDHLQDVLRGALGGPAGASPACVAPAVAPAGTERTVEDAAAPTPLDPGHPTPRQAEETEAITPAPGDGSASHPVASEPPPAGEGAFAAWATAHAVSIGLVGLGVVAITVALTSLGMKHARHRNEVMRRYRP